ncbi:MAG: FAD-dependent oxidoreductase [Eggerthellaceae bacterium]|jgi:putative selenate reductase|nr:FAD-dependent oxidoreductase [Eggerthellaceae bacterium]MCH4221465.1 FAD-dependent oxidoreductase [Eggerthellaceae bacterium]
MSERMRPLPFDILIMHALAEYHSEGSIFGIRKEKFYRCPTAQRMTLAHHTIDTPIGPAAGPHTQLAQNIIAAFLAGGRFIELKTVQVVDGRALQRCIARPCISAQDEGFNVEWSSELTVAEATEEYIKAWIAIHLLGAELSLDTNVIFNMSVGYDLQGITSAKITRYFAHMRNATRNDVWDTAHHWIRKHSDLFHTATQKDIDSIPYCVSDTVTVSTLHGCPQEEIQSIASYLITKQHFHTFVKCNPTILGYESTRELLDGFGYTHLLFGRTHFREDLQFSDAVSMVRALMIEAHNHNLVFGLKISNTLPVEVHNKELPGNEMYASGRVLFPLALTIAARFSRLFAGSLPISYSGGADIYTLPMLLSMGIHPITFATTLLKPGGYERLNQLAMCTEGNRGITKQTIDVEQLNQYVERIYRAIRTRQNDMDNEQDPCRTIKHKDISSNIGPYRQDQYSTQQHTDANDDCAHLFKNYYHAPPYHIARTLPLFDCAEAPCRGTGCPIKQQIPAYLTYVHQGNASKALQIILNDNVLPSITGAICPHRCQSFCTRNDYEFPINIRAAKRWATTNCQDTYIRSLSPTPLRTSTKAVIVGAGPVGIAVASYLRRNGVSATIMEYRAEAMGMVSHVIPSFRINKADIQRDIDLAKAYGVTFQFNVDYAYSLDQLQQSYDFIIIATGAWSSKHTPLPLDGTNVMGAIDFLMRLKKNSHSVSIGPQVAVIGGGDVAIDCARAAQRHPGVTQSFLIARKARPFLTASQEELEYAEEDGVAIVDGMTTQSYEHGSLLCMASSYDHQGCTCTAEDPNVRLFNIDTVILATGSRANNDLLERNGLILNPNGYPRLSSEYETSRHHIYAIGDCAVGPCTIVEGMAQAKSVAQTILKRLDLANDFKTFPINASRSVALERKGILNLENSADRSVSSDTSHCLLCDSVCELCADVCPNRANFALHLNKSHSTDPLIKEMGHYQIVHLDRLCNECGNCATFCPSSGKPYRDKPTLFSDKAAFESSENPGFLRISKTRYRTRNEHGCIIDYELDDPSFPAGYRLCIQSLVERYPHLLAIEEE